MRRETRELSLGQVLSITTGRLLCPVSELQDTLEFIMGGPVWTHEMPTASDIATQHILEGYPGLADVEVPSQLSGWPAARAWLREQGKSHPGPFPVAPLPEPNRWTELTMKAGGSPNARAALTIMAMKEGTET